MEDRKHYNVSTPAKRPTPLVKGHDAVLKAIQESKQTATIVTRAGEVFVGQITGRDKFTITLLTGTIRRIFYKHAVEQFFAEEKAAS
jgi:sRNA-binding regulator protein Hfq